MSISRIYLARTRTIKDTRLKKICDAGLLGYRGAALHLASLGLFVASRLVVMPGLHNEKALARPPFCLAGTILGPHAELHPGNSPASGSCRKVRVSRSTAPGDARGFGSLRAAVSEGRSRENFQRLRLPRLTLKGLQSAMKEDERVEQGL